MILHILEKKELNRNVVLLGDYVGRGIFLDWKIRGGSIAKFACNQATETAGQYFFLRRYLENNRIPGVVIICDRSPESGDLSAAG